ncbi:MAG: hypothetical protein HZC41_03465 [Chloroflexi bacterium]|nr:hypothetical protein [Chloroflexota bacterium]
MSHKLRYPVIVLMLLLLALGWLTANAQQPTTCPYGQGYWKNTAQWPVTQLTLGSQTYSQAELLILFNMPSQGDASLILAHQLIAAKLNAAAGVDVTAINGIIAQADALLATFPNRLPYAVEPSSVNGQGMTSMAGVLDVFNNGQLTTGCAPFPTATPTPTGTPPTATPTPTGTLTPEATDDGLPVIIVVEGPVKEININIITIYNIKIEVDVNDPILTVIRVGDYIRVEGNVVSTGATIVIVAINIIIVDTDVVIVDGGLVWRDDGGCGNPPPPWAPANGWRRRCQPTIIIIDQGSGSGMGMGK